MKSRVSKNCAKAELALNAKAAAINKAKMRVIIFLAYRFHCETGHNSPDFASRGRVRTALPAQTLRKSINLRVADVCGISAAM